MLYGALALFVFIGLVLRLEYQISRPFLAAFIFTSWFFLAGFRIGLRNLIPALSREFGLKRYILVVGLGMRAERLGAHARRILRRRNPDRRLPRSSGCGPGARLDTTESRIPGITAGHAARHDGAAGDRRDPLRGGIG